MWKLSNDAIWGRISLGNSGPSLRKISLSVPCGWSNSSGVCCKEHKCHCTIAGFHGYFTNSQLQQVSRKVRYAPIISEPGGTLCFLLVVGNLALADTFSFALLIPNTMVLTIAPIFRAHIFIPHSSYHVPFLCSPPSDHNPLPPSRLSSHVTASVRACPDSILSNVASLLHPFSC